MKANKILIILLFLITVFNQKVFSQEDIDYEADKIENPSFVGGEKAYKKFMKYNFEYPVQALDKGIEEVVKISFTIEEDGKITNAKIVKDIGGGCGAEALRLVKEMPKWNPGKRNGKPVKVNYSMTFPFYIAEFY